MAFYVIDRLEGRIAVIVGDDGRTFDVPKGRLPPGSREGMVLRLETEGGRAPDWSRAVIDDAERARRVQRAREMLRNLEESDPGGDITL
ncbi:MAG TPA: DUF3006 domain-containing protein [Gemmatimonadales bacterium]|nr:DUF3006 domain-containing protein [Gemmatimonadales bacterium]